VLLSASDSLLAHVPGAGASVVVVVTVVVAVAVGLAVVVAATTPQGRSINVSIYVSPP